MTTLSEEKWVLAFKDNYSGEIYFTSLQFDGEAESLTYLCDYYNKGIKFLVVRLAEDRETKAHRVLPEPCSYIGIAMPKPAYWPWQDEV